MNSGNENQENDYEKAGKSGTSNYGRHLKVQSVVYPSRKDIELQRKSYSSPSKTYRRMSGVERVEIKVCVAAFFCHR